MKEEREKEEVERLTILEAEKGTVTPNSDLKQ